MCLPLLFSFVECALSPWASPAAIELFLAQDFTAYRDPCLGSGGEGCAHIVVVCLQVKESRQHSGHQQMIFLDCKAQAACIMILPLKE